ncbi:MAG: hypothetical protein IKQ08_10985 [Paludibacteraceae bacterium]|nr:hypothetical protein [Paludibacteraceae bacterium]
MMKSFIDCINFIFIVFVVIYPIFIVPFIKDKKYLVILILAFIIVDGVLLLVYFGWDDYSTKWLMEYYGYDLDGMSESECYRNVEPGDRVMVEGMSSHIMGIGWPLRAVFAYVLIIPFQIILSFIEYYVIRHLKAC